MKKLHNNRGESLIEVLASIVIGSLSVALMFGCIMVSAKMDEDTKDWDKQHYKDLTAADAQDAAPVTDDSEELDGSGESDDSDESDGSGDSDGSDESDGSEESMTGTVTIRLKGEDPDESGNSATLKIKVYGGAGMYSYTHINHQSNTTGGD